jgi:hypothetical protein
MKKIYAVPNAIKIGCNSLPFLAFRRPGRKGGLLR